MTLRPIEPWPSSAAARIRRPTIEDCPGSQRAQSFRYRAKASMAPKMVRVVRVGLLHGMKRSRLFRYRWFVVSVYPVVGP
jgi:hypothetical protein